jgi:hypothetical protein
MSTLRSGGSRWCLILENDRGAVLLIGTGLVPHQSPDTVLTCSLSPELSLEGRRRLENDLASEESETGRSGIADGAVRREESDRGKSIVDNVELASGSACAVECGIPCNGCV